LVRVQPEDPLPPPSNMSPVELPPIWTCPDPLALTVTFPLVVDVATPPLAFKVPETAKVPVNALPELTIERELAPPIKSILLPE